jgi:hypothetical protein
MDITAVRGLLAASLDSDADNRRRAELQLKSIEENEGFMNCLLDILQSEQEASVRLASQLPLPPFASTSGVPPGRQSSYLH